MPHLEPSSYPSLAERALRYLERRPGASDEDLCSHLFGLPKSLLSGGRLARWARLLEECIGDDAQFVRVGPGYWALRESHSGEMSGSLPGSSRLGSEEVIALAVVADGPKPWADRVVGIAALHVGGPGTSRPAIGRTAGGSVVLGRWDSVTRPERPRHLPAYLRDLGLGPAVVEEAPTFADIAADLRAFLGSLPLIGVDVGLAVAYLQFEFRRLGQTALTNPLVDLVALVDLPEVGLVGARGTKVDLDRVAASLGVPPADRRSLASRARLSADVGRHLLQRAESAGIGCLEDLLAAFSRSAAPTASLDASRHRFLMDRSSIESFPTEPGVYLLEDGEGYVHYVGKATCLRSRLESYLGADLGRSRQMAGIVEATARVETQTTPTELEALLLEARLIARLRPRYNVQRRRESELVYLCRKVESGQAAARGQRWAAAERGYTPDSLGPIQPADARRLLAEARSRFRLAARRGSDRWAARAVEAWTWLAQEVAATRVVGELTASGLSAFAMIAVWPAPLAERTFAEESEEEVVAVGHAGWLVSSEETSSPGCEPPLPLGKGWGEGHRDSEGALSDAQTAVRLVLFGRGGWAGGITIEDGATLDEVTQQATRAIDEVNGTANPSAAAELAAALQRAGGGALLSPIRLPRTEIAR